MTSNRKYSKNTIRYNVVRITCSEKLTCSHLSPLRGTNRKIKEKIKEKNELKINREAKMQKLTLNKSWHWLKDTKTLKSTKS